MKAVATTALLTVLVVGIASPSQARDLYVSLDGLDSSSGLTPALAVRTIERAADLALPGDTIRVMAGVYVQSIRIFRSGSPGNPIVFRPYGDGSVVLDGQFQGCPPGELPHSPLAYGIWGGAVHDIVVEGFEIRNYCYLGIDFEGVQRITVRDNFVHHNGITLPEPSGPGQLSGQGIYVNGPNGRDVVIERNVVTDNCPRNRHSGSAIAVNAIDGAVVRDNVSERNNGNGILVEDGMNVVVENNVIRFNVADLGTWGTAGVWVDGGSDVAVRYNWIEGNVWAGLEITDEESADPYGDDIHDNVVVGNWYGLILEGIGRAGAAPNLIYNNTFVDSARAGIWMPSYRSPATALRDTQLASNLVAQSTVDVPALLAETLPYVGVTMNHDVLHRAGSTTPVRFAGVDRTFAEYQALTGWSSAGTTADPALVNPAAGDYRLAPGSVAIDAGAPAPSSANDYAGISRPIGTGIDIGAYEYGVFTEPVVIEWLTATPTATEPGRDVLLAWSVHHATGTDLQPDVGTVLPVTTRVVAPTATTTYTLTAEGLDGPVAASVTVTVVPPNPHCTAAESTAKSQLTLRAGRLGVNGRFALHQGVPIAADTTGWRVIVTERTGLTFVDRLDVVLPPGSLGAPANCDPADGWKTNAHQTSFAYANRSGALPPACTPGSASGITKAKLTDKRGKGLGLFATVQANEASWNPTAADERLITVVLGDGTCAWTRFTPGTCGLASNGLRCRRAGVR